MGVTGMNNCVAIYHAAPGAIWTPGIGTTMQICGQFCLQLSSRQQLQGLSVVSMHGCRRQVTTSAWARGSSFALLGEIYKTENAWLDNISTNLMWSFVNKPLLIPSTRCCPFRSLLQNARLLALDEATAKWVVILIFKWMSGLLS